MKTSAAVLVGFAIGVGAVVIGQRLFPTPLLFGLKAAMCDAVVRISLDASGNPTVTPDKVCLAKNRELTWDIDPQMEAGEVEIKFHDKDKGPFLKDKPHNPHNEDRGWYLRKKADKRPIRSNGAEKIGYWPYTVSYTPNGSAKPMTLDPAVCIRD